MHFGWLVNHLWDSRNQSRSVHCGWIVNHLWDSRNQCRFCIVMPRTPQRASSSNLDLLLSIGGMANFTLQFSTNEMISVFTSQSFLSSNLRRYTMYFFFISQLIRYAGACSSYECFVLRVRRLSSKLLKQGYLVNA